MPGSTNLPTGLDSLLDGFSTYFAEPINAIEQIVVGPIFYNALGAGIKFDGVTDNGTAFNTFLAGLPSGAVVICPPGTCISSPIVPPLEPKTISILGSGIGSTIFQPNAANSKVFDTSGLAGVISGGTYSNFSIKAHAAGSTGTAIDLARSRGMRFENIGYLTNGTGNYNSLFSMGGAFCYGNEIVRPFVQSQTGPTTVIKFVNAGTSATNANVNYIRNGWFYANTGITTIIDALRSTQTVIENCEFEQNTGATAIIPGTMCLIRSNWFELNSVSLSPQSVGGQGASNSVTLLNNYFSSVETLTLPSTVANWLIIGNTVNLTVVDQTKTSLIINGGAFSGHIVSPFGGSPGPVTLGALFGGISTQTVNRSTDTAGDITLVTTGSPPTAGSQIAAVTFAQAYQNTPIVIVQMQTGSGSIANSQVQPFFVTTTGFSIYTIVNMGASLNYVIGYWVIGT